MSFVNSGSFSKQHSCLSVRVSQRTRDLMFSTYGSKDAPAQLKKELDMVLTLQAEVDMVEKGIQTAKTTIVKSECSQESLLLIQGLERTHERLQEKIEKLYASLNVHDSFPELRGINLEFVRTLLMARDLKMNIRKRAISSFFEWEKLDRAVGGHHEPLGQY